MRPGLLPVIATSCCLIVSTPFASAGPVDDLRDRLMNRAGEHSEDRRENEFAARTPIGPGPKTGCHGDTVVARVRINSVEGSINGATAALAISFSGNYTRQGWMTPCVQSPPPNGREDRRVFGTIELSITQRQFKAPDFAWGPLTRYGEVNDPGHDSNAVAVAAARNAIMSAF